MIIAEGDMAIRGVAGTAGAIDYTITGREVWKVGDEERVLGQGTLSGSAADLYVVPSATRATIGAIILANKTGSDVSGVILTLDGYRISSAMVIPAGGSAALGENGWSILSTTGSAAAEGTSGCALVADGDTVPHTLGVIPKSVVITPSRDATFGTVPEASKNAVDFAVSLKTNAGEPDVVPQWVNWEAKRP